MKEHTLVTFWKEQIENAEEINLNDSALKLQRQAEIDVAERKSAFLDAEQELRKAKVAAKDNPRFNDIVDSTLEVIVSEKKYKNALAVYKDMFGEEPKLLEVKEETPAESSEPVELPAEEE